MTDENLSEIGYLKLREVLELIPVSKSTWFRGIQSGKYPKPVKIGIRASAWRKSDIRACIEELNADSKISAV